MTYRVIVADPPWEISKLYRRVRPNQTTMDYPTMSLEKIKQLRVAPIADDPSILFLWTIDKFLHDSFDVVFSWGFRYHVTMAWDKGNGMSLYGFHRQTEFVLVGMRGKHEAFPHRSTIPTAFSFKSSRHSAKPDEFYKMIESAYSGPRIDLFARKPREGWDVWGNEVESGITL